jgi:Xaa-Pro aminopeptidase
MNNEHLQRIQKLQRAMVAANLDALFLYSEINRTYFTGLTTSNGLLLVEQQGTPTFYTDFRYIEVANRTLTNINIQTFKPAAEQYKAYSAMAQSWKTIGYEGSLTVAQFLPLQEALAHAKWENASALIATLRGVKSPSEIAALRKSAAANDALFKDLLEIYRPGMREIDMQRIWRTKAAERLDDAVHLHGVVGTWIHASPPMLTRLIPVLNPKPY